MTYLYEHMRSAVSSDLVHLNCAVQGLAWALSFSEAWSSWIPASIPLCSLADNTSYRVSADEPRILDVLFVGIDFVCSGREVSPNWAHTIIDADGIPLSTRDPAPGV